MNTLNTPIGFIGQGFIGKNYANDFEARGLKIVRHAKEPPYDLSREAIKECNIVFVAVPTPTTKEGYDPSIVRNVIRLARPGSVVVLKSTILPGLTRKFQEEFPEHIILHSPEFLSEVTAAEDAAHPFMNIIGIPEDTPAHRQAAELVHSVLPPAPYSKTVSSDEAELIKYSHNLNGYTQIIFFNLMFDMATKLGADWNNIAPALDADPFISSKYITPVHKSGRGAGGHCFIKDMAAFREAYGALVGDRQGVEVLKSLEEKNKSLLTQSGKDTELLAGVYGA